MSLKHLRAQSSGKPKNKETRGPSYVNMVEEAIVKLIQGDPVSLFQGLSGEE